MQEPSRLPGLYGWAETATAAAVGESEAGKLRKEEEEERETMVGHIRRRRFIVIVIVVIRHDVIVVLGQRWWRPCADRRAAHCCRQCTQITSRVRHMRPAAAGDATLHAPLLRRRRTDVGAGV